MTLRYRHGPSLRTRSRRSGRPGATIRSAGRSLTTGYSAAFSEATRRCRRLALSAGGAGRSSWRPRRIH